MGLTSIIILAALGLVVVYGIMLYNGLVQLSHNVSKSWANIDVLLKQRHDELPKLVETCKQYKEFEQKTLAQVIAARNQVHEAREKQDLGALGRAERDLKVGLGNIFAVAEAYPQLKTNETFQHLLARITSLESAIADRREFYNDSVNLNNVRIQQFPDLIVASLFGFGEARLLDFPRQEKRDVDMKQLFASN